MDFPTLSSRVLDDALQMGASKAEVYAKTGVATELKMHQGRVDTLSSSEEEGLGLRFVLPGGRWGYAWTSDLSPANVGHLLEEAFRAAEEADEQRGELLLPGRAGEAPPTSEELDIWSPSLVEAATGEKIDRMRRIENAATSADPSVRWVDTLLHQDGWTEVRLRNTEGFEGSWRRTLASVSVHVLARIEDSERSILSHHHEAACSFEALDPDEIGRRAALRAAEPLGGRRIGPRRVTVVLEPHVAGQILEFVAPSVLGSAWQRGRSLFRDRMGEQVASSKLTLVDDGRLPGGLGTAPFDGDGVPTGRTVLIQDGVLRGLLHDARSAAESGATSTGNAVRRTYRQRPRIGVRNLMVQPGEVPTTQLLLDVDEALQVANLTSVGGVNPVTGTFSAMASGVWVERGREKFPVSGVTLSGDLGEMLGSISAVGDDPSWYHGDGHYRSPTLVIEGMTVAG